MEVLFPQLHYIVTYGSQTFKKLHAVQAPIEETLSVSSKVPANFKKKQSALVKVCELLLQF